MSLDNLTPGVLTLAIDLRQLQQRHGLAEVVGVMPLPDGHEITLRWNGNDLQLEREDGHRMQIGVLDLA